MDSRTPSLDDGGLVHFSGPRLIGYEQLPCQTRIGIGVTQRISHLAIGLILESEVTVIVDQYQCVKTDLVSPKYRRS